MDLKIPPLLVMLAAAALMATTLLFAEYGIPTVPYAAACLSAAGCAVAAAGVRAFQKARTTVNPLVPENSSSMVTGGIYRFSRNPMYLGMVLVLSGWALYLGSAAAWLGVAGFAAYINRFQIVPEEKILSVKFGAAYREYCRRTRRWI